MRRDRPYSRHLICTAFLAACAGAAIGDSAVLTRSANGHKYQLIETKRNWDDAKADAESRGGHLVTIGSSDEQDWITSSFFSVPGQPQCWTGLVQEDAPYEDAWQPNEQWNWVTGEAVAFVNWSPPSTEPNDWPGVTENNEENHSRMNVHTLGGWNDSSRSETAFYMVEWESGTLNVPGSYSTIQAAINAAADGDTIIVGPGTYYENINFLGKAITVRGTDPTDPAVVDATIIDGQQNGPVVAFTQEERPETVLAGLTLTNGKTYYGAGVYCYGSSPTISQNVIAGNTAYREYNDIGGRGGGIYCRFGAPLIERNTIRDNAANGLQSSGWGGGICCWGSSATIRSNQIIGNLATRDWGTAGEGGGICAHECSPLIESNSITANQAKGAGGGIMCRKAPALIEGNTISNNKSGSGGGINCLYSSPVIRSNLITGNEARIGPGSGNWGRGGGVYLSGSSPTIEGATIANNAAATDGGGISVDKSSRPTIRGCTISRNSARDRGGGISCTRSFSLEICSPTIVDCIVAFSTDGGGLYAGSGTTPTVSHSDFYGNVGGNYTGAFSDPMGTDGNISEDPLFAAASNGDYHLKSVGGRWNPIGGTWVIDSVHSPCIDAGDPQADRSQEPAPNGDRVNMGAHGNTPEASKFAEPSPITGTVALRGSGLQHATIWAEQVGGAWQNSTTTEADGTYEIHIPDSGKYKVYMEMNTVEGHHYGHWAKPSKRVVIAPADNVNFTAYLRPRTIEWSNYLWHVRDTNGTLEDAGPNYYSDSPENVWVDPAGKLHLRITRRHGHWYCPEIQSRVEHASNPDGISPLSFGYGDYVFYVSSRYDQLDPQAVGGFFTYENGVGNHNRELDIEFSRWGVPGDPENSQYVVQPHAVAGHKHRFASPLSGDPFGTLTTHKIAWWPGMAEFQSYSGHSRHLTRDEDLIAHWNTLSEPLLKATDIPRPGNEELILNLWLYGDKEPKPYSGDEARLEMVVDRVIIEPLVQRRPDIVLSDPTGWIGDNVYEASATQQKTTREVFAGFDTVHKFRVQNDAPTPEKMRITGAGDHGKWHVRYVLKDGTDVTDDVIGDGWKPTLLPGEHADVRVRIHTEAGLAADATRKMLVAAGFDRWDQSTFDAQRDTGKLLTRIVLPPQEERPDVWVVDGAVWIGDNYYNTKGNYQKTTRTIQPGVRTSYKLRVYNDTPVKERLRITGPAGSGKWTVTYQTTGGADLTPKITGAGWRPSVGPGKFAEVRVKVAAAASMAPDSKLALLARGGLDRWDEATFSAKADTGKFTTRIVSSTSGAPQIASLSAVPTPAGAQVTFSLSAPASVQAHVLNIAGRPVKTLCMARECPFGANTLLWNAKSDRGLTAPNGTYLVEVTARTDDGTEARALAQLRLAR